MENTKKLKFSNLMIAILQGVILLLLFVIPELVVGVIGGVVAKFVGFDLSLIHISEPTRPY